MKDDLSKYSVLMSLYVKEKPECLRLALDSMICQTVKPDEIVLVEDGPLTEELYAVVNEYLSAYPTLFNVVVNEKNLGLGLALQNGLNACKNELVARMDTDDIAKLDRCEKQIEYMAAHPEVTIVGGQIEEFIDDVNSVVGKRVVPLTDEELKRYMKKRCPFNHMTVMFRRSHILEVDSYQEWFWNEDYYLWIRLALEGKKFGNLPEILVNVRVGADMYQRRGGSQYFRSEKALQDYMLNHKMIGVSTYLMNICKRLIIQILLPNRLRGWVFRKFARS